MNPQDAIDLGREAVKACMMVGAPILLASLVIGLLVGVAQAMTQIQDQTVSFVPKLLCLLFVLGLCLPWLADQLVDYSRETWSKPMTHFHASAPVSRAGFLRTAGHSFQESRKSKNAPPLDLQQRQEPETEFESPFSLPHYRYSRLPKENIDG